MRTPISPGTTSSSKAIKPEADRSMQFHCWVCLRSFKSRRALGRHQNKHRKEKSDKETREKLYCPENPTSTPPGNRPDELWLGPGLPTGEWKENQDALRSGGTFGLEPGIPPENRVGEMEE